MIDDADQGHRPSDDRSAGPAHRPSDDPVLAALEGTLLGADVTQERARTLADAAVEHGLAGICLPMADLLGLVEAGRLPAGLDRVTVANFPFGDLPETEAILVARKGHEMGATWIDVVFRRDRILAGSIPSAPADLPLRIILETSAYRSESEMLRAAEILVARGFRHLKTSTGFHPSQIGPPLAAVGALARGFGETITIKASGKIRTRAEALALLDAGASRLGASAVSELRPPP